MSDSRKTNPFSKLDRLKPEQQEAVFAHCEKGTIAEGRRWVKTEFDVQISISCLSVWLQKRRSQQSIMAPERKIRTDCKLNILDREQQEAIYAHCESVSVNEGVRWIKEEFDLEVCFSGLTRWLQRQRTDKALMDRLEDIRDDRDRALLMGRVIGSATPITEANSVLFSQAVFEEFRKASGERDEGRLVKFMALALKAREQELKSRTVDLGFSRHHFDAAKKSLAFAPQLLRIHESSDDERAKIEQAIVVLFGEDPAGFESSESASSSSEEAA